MWLKTLIVTWILTGWAFAATWTMFAPLDAETTSLEGLAECPETVNGVAGTQVEFTDDRYADVKKVIAPGQLALFVQAIDSEEDATRSMGFGANYFMKAYVNGELLLDTWQYGNKPYIGYLKSEFIRNVSLKKGKNVIAVYVRHNSGALTLGCGFTPDRDPVAEAPTKEHYARILAEYPRSGAERLLAERIIANGVSDMRATDFWKYYNVKNDEVQAHYEKYPIFFFWDGALAKILRELPATQPKDGEVVLWHLYNMGYVVKTSKSCFGIDINHRRASELVPYLDFCMVTHAHSDHFTYGFLNAMRAAGKPVISYFFQCDSRLKLRADAQLASLKDKPTAQEKQNHILNYCANVESAEYVFGDVRVETAQSDHNPGLPKFITNYRITCGTGERPLVIFHSGDSCRHDQLNPSGPVDVHINHPRVSMNEVKAAEKIRPNYVFFSHLLEMGHCPPSRYTAFPFVWLEKDIKAVEALGCRAVCPFWGEKYVFVNAKLLE